MVGKPALIARLVAAVSLAAITLLAGTATPASAHTALLLTVRTDGHGSVAVDVAWADGHPVTETVAGTVIALSDANEQVGPAPLTRGPGTATVAYGGRLNPGAWQVTVDVARPGIGHCAAEVVVADRAAAAQPSSQRCGEPAPEAATRSADRPGPPVALFAAAATIALGTVAALLVRRFRPARPATGPDRRTRRVRR